MKVCEQHRVNSTMKLATYLPLLWASESTLLTLGGQDGLPNFSWAEMWFTHTNHLC